MPRSTVSSLEPISSQNLSEFTELKLYNRNYVLMPSWHVLTLWSRLLQCNMGSWKFSDLCHDFFGFADTDCTTLFLLHWCDQITSMDYFWEIEKLMTISDRELENQLKVWKKLPSLYHKVKFDFLILRIMSVTGLFVTYQGGKIIKFG